MSRLTFPEFAFLAAAFALIALLVLVVIWSELREIRQKLAALEGAAQEGSSAVDAERLVRIREILRRTGGDRSARSADDHA